MDPAEYLVLVSVVTAIVVAAFAIGVYVGWAL
jgi:hypothetical protein